MKKGVIAALSTAVLTAGLLTAAPAGAATNDGPYNCRAKGGAPVFIFVGSAALANICLAPQSQTGSGSSPNDPIANCAVGRGGVPVYVFVGSAALVNACLLPQSP